MTHSDPFEPLHQRHEADEKHEHRFADLIRQWEGPVREGLHRLGHALWENRHILGLVPVHDHRIRRQSEPDGYLWWVEHDVEPYADFKCAAYRVKLRADAQDYPSLSVHSAAAEYPVEPLTIERFDEVLAQAGQDPPLVIPRRMGEAHD